MCLVILVIDDNVGVLMRTCEMIRSGVTRNVFCRKVDELAGMARMLTAYSTIA